MQKKSRKDLRLVPQIECLEDRISPAILDTTAFGSRNPDVGGPYNWTNPSISIKSIMSIPPSTLTRPPPTRQTNTLEPTSRPPILPRCPGRNMKWT